LAILARRCFGYVGTPLLFPACLTAALDPRACAALAAMPGCATLFIGDNCFLRSIGDGWMLTDFFANCDCFGVILDDGSHVQARWGQSGKTMSIALNLPIAPRPPRYCCVRASGSLATWMCVLLHH
jgi:hypothetical protein